MKFLNLLILQLVLGIGVSISAPQQIHWADRLIFQHNQYSDTAFDGNQVLGFPDAKPYGKLNKHAFRLKEENSYGIIKVGYNNPIPVSQIVVVENFLPNRISKLILEDVDGNEHLIYEPRKEWINVPARILSINIEKTPYKVAAVTIHLNTIEKSGWAQIDAIGISEVVYSDDKLNEIIQIDDFESEENFRFAKEKEKLSENINSSYGEAKPILSPDGKTLYYVRKFSPENIGGASDEQDIYYSELVNGKWTVGQNIGQPLNDKYPNGICSISPDGNTLYLLNSYDTLNGIIQDGISKSVRLENGSWSTPVSLNIDNFNNISEFQDYSMSPSGKILLLAIETQGSVGEQDIYVSFLKEDDTWTKPQNLGRSVNSEGIEYSPLLSADEKVLFFASTGHGPNEMGDIYYSKRLDHTWLNWSKPKNIGLEVNTPGLDSYFTISPENKYAYFVSTVENSGEGENTISGLDIYRIPLNIEPEPERQIAMNGKIFREEDNAPIYANITLKSMKSAEFDAFTITDARNGNYDVKLSNNDSYLVTIEAIGYITVIDTIDFVTEEDAGEITRHFGMTSVKKGHRFALNNLFFVQSKPELLPQSAPELDRLYTLLMDHPKMKIELSGHTDSEGYRSANMRLSEERANAVKDYLLNKGIHKNRLKAVGYGPNRPVAANDTEENRAKNRRVEVEILDL